MRVLLLFLLLATSAGADLASGMRFYDIRSGDPLQMGPVTADRVEGFEILYATPGSGDISEIAGHLLLRIRIDGAPDLVASFLADTESQPGVRSNAVDVVQETCRGRNWFNLVQTPSDDEEPAWASLWQSLKGLAGGFEVIMDLQTLDHVLKTYTVEQDRTLWRYALLLSGEQTAGLLKKLEQVQHAGGPPYYFFSQNCGSVLVQIIGEGIGHRKVAEFHPMVSPPHSLIALLMREELARPVAPHFHSFRQRGFLARRAFARHHGSSGDFTSASEDKRTLAVLALQNQGLPPQELARLAALIPEMEMAFDAKDRVCRDYTSSATAAARGLQRSLRGYSVDVEAELRAVPAYHALADGTRHTGLYVLHPGIAQLAGDTQASLNGALLLQEMGSGSQMAMQRAGAVELGGFGLLADSDGMHGWRLTGLSLNKFRENLGRVPSIFESSRGLGLGLGVLNLESDPRRDADRLDWGEVHALFNLCSSERHLNYLTASAGLVFGKENAHGLGLPLQLQALLSFGRVQCRFRGEYRRSFIPGNKDTLRLRNRVSLLLGEAAGIERRLHLEADLLESGSREEWMFSVGLELRRW